MTATQAPTPGPLTDAERYEQAKRDFNRMRDDGSLPAPTAPVEDEPEVRCVNAHDRCYEGGPCPYCEPTAPVEASGSEREKLIEVVLSFPETVDLPTQRAEDLANEVLAALRPQPSGETREAVARLTKDVATVKSFSANAATFYDGPDKRYIGDVAADIETLLALLSARPLALGGQS